MKQKVIVNCRFLTQPITGVQRFAIELCKELKQIAPDYVFVAPKNIIHHKISDELGVRWIGTFKGHLWEQIDLKLFVDKENAMLLSLCNTAPLFLNNQIITIHDLCFLKHPEWFSFTFRKAYRFLIPRIAKKARHIFTVSETSKLEIIDTLQTNENKVSVVYNAVARIFKDFIPSSQNQEEQINDKYILSVSSYHPRKNFKKLIEAFLELDNFDYKLVVVGNPNKHFKDTSLMISDDRILFKENVTDDELILLYKNATLFVFPSLYEGFGLPIIEAMSLGTSVCVSDIAVFREICKENATYFDPNSIEDIKEKVQFTVQNPIKSNEQYIKNFSWKKSAEKVFKQANQIRN